MDLQIPSSKIDKNILVQESLLALLKTYVVEVTFLKINGDERIMKCTLIPDLMPLIDADKVKLTTARNNSTCVVWAIDSAEFRSFRYDRISEVKVMF